MYLEVDYAVEAGMQQTQEMTVVSGSLRVARVALPLPPAVLSVSRSESDHQLPSTNSF